MDAALLKGVDRRHVVQFFENVDDSGIENNAESFDVTGNGRIASDDAVTLFEMLSGAGPSSEGSVRTR